MLHSILFVAVFVALAGRALALNITFGGSLGNITASQLLAIPQGPYSMACMSQCNTANSTINACGDTNQTCLCTNTVGSQLEACEQCLFNQLVEMNLKAPDPRVGSMVGMTAFTTACVNASLTPLKLALPSTWEGPTDIILNTPATVVVVGFGAFFGLSALWLLSNF